MSIRLYTLFVPFFLYACFTTGLAWAEEKAVNVSFKEIMGCKQENGAMVGMTAEHNKARAALNKGIPPLTWDGKVACYSLSWAKTQAKHCADIKHRETSPYGESYGAVFGQAGTAKNIFAMWLTEKSSFNHSTKKCAAGKVCDHYTQIIWKNTAKLGCGFAACDCSNKQNCLGMSTGEVWFCNYDPPGNYGGQAPY